MRRSHGALPGLSCDLRTSGVAFPFVLERLSNPPARPQDLSRVTNTEETTKDGQHWFTVAYSVTLQEMNESPCATSQEGYFANAPVPMAAIS